MKVNGVWNVKDDNVHMVIEMPDRSLKIAPIYPVQPISEEMLKENNGYHPRRLSGEPLPGWLYSIFGLERSNDIANVTIHIRVTPTEKEILEKTASTNGKKLSEFVRDWIATLSKD